MSEEKCVIFRCGDRLATLLMIESATRDGEGCTWERENQDEVPEPPPGKGFWIGQGNLRERGTPQYKWVWRGPTRDEQARLLEFGTLWPDSELWDKRQREREAKFFGERMLTFFGFADLPEPLQEITRPFCYLAQDVVDSVQAGPERTVALRKLLESKEAAVRAFAFPGR